MRKEHHILIIILLFVLFNALKITLFNIFTVYTDSLFSTFLFKLLLSMSVSFLIFYLFIKMKNVYLFSAFYFFQIFYILVMLVHFIYFKRHLHFFYSIELSSEGLEAARNFAIPASPKLLIALIDFPLFILLVKKFSAIKKMNSSMKYTKKMIAFVCILFIMATEVTSIFGEDSFIHLLNSTKVNDNDVVLKYGTLAVNIMDLINLNRGFDFSENIQYGDFVTNTSENDHPNNVLVIQVESLDSSIIGFEFNGIEITPFMNRLSRESIFYPFMLSYHKAGGSSDSEIALFNSFEPFDAFPTSQLEGYDFSNSIVHAFKDAEYRTKAFHGNTSTFYKRNETYPLHGFDFFYGFDEMGLEPSSWGALDHDVFAYMTAQMAQEKEPFFYHLITMTTHGPFNFVEDGYFNIEHRNTISQGAYNYFNSFAYFDMHLEKLIEEVQFLFPNTYIFIFGDHTGSLETDEYASSAIVMNLIYHEFVPLFIVPPSGNPHLETQKAASFLDMGITILEAAGILYSIKTLGENLLNPQALNTEVPLSGLSYDRKDLFDLAQSTLQMP